jgi:hypothetical protein
MYTVANCLGKDKNAAMANIHTLMPHVANTAVVTEKQPFSSRVSSERRKRDAQWPGMALKRAIKAILKPPSRTTRARQPYCMFVFSSFSPRARQQNLKALHVGTVSAYASQVADDALKVA